MCVYRERRKGGGVVSRIIMGSAGPEAFLTVVRQERRDYSHAMNFVRDARARQTSSETPRKGALLDRLEERKSSIYSYTQRGIEMAAGEGIIFRN